jgi:hypothetical protein
MTNQIEQSGFVPVAGTETYYRRLHGREESGEGLSVQWEGFVITQGFAQK